MADRFAKGIAVLFHPVFIPLYTLILLLRNSVAFSFVIPAKTQLFLILTVAGTTIIFPILMVLLFYRLKVVNSLLLRTREERIYPLIIVAIFYYLTYFLLKNYPICIIFSYYMLGSTFLVICALLISFWMKVSLHMLGIGGLVGAFVGLSMVFSVNTSYQLIPIILISGIVGTARLYEESHTPFEVYTGFLTGSLVMMSLFLLI